MGVTMTIWAGRFSSDLLQCWHRLNINQFMSRLTFLAGLPVLSVVRSCHQGWTSLTVKFFALLYQSLSLTVMSCHGSTSLCPWQRSLVLALPVLSPCPWQWSLVLSLPVLVFDGEVLSLLYHSLSLSVRSCPCSTSHCQWSLVLALPLLVLDSEVLSFLYQSLSLTVKSCPCSTSPCHCQWSLVVALPVLVIVSEILSLLYHSLSLTVKSCPYSTSPCPCQWDLVLALPVLVLDSEVLWFFLPVLVLDSEVLSLLYHSLSLTVKSCPYSTSPCHCQW